MMTSLKTILKNFLNHVDHLESQKKLGQDPFEVEFQKLKDLTEQLKQDPDYSCSQGECDVNRRKNRYKDILPYNYTRVILSEYPGVPGSDYINANYIKGGSGSLAYIASQGPLPNTMVDFWRMIWECEVQVVVMACKEQESGKYKCERYWPDEGEQRQYGNITVELVKWRQVCPDFLVRTLKACWEDESRTICQFHYASWPDHGVPTSVQPILELVRLVRDCQASEALPVLVHCSAGCGRTGTICAIDYVWGLMRMGKLTKSFSLYEIIAEMRRQRIAMVQTKEQYYLVHRAVASMFEQQLRVIDSHTYENLDEDGEPLIWRELKQECDSIYEDVYEPDCLTNQWEENERGEKMKKEFSDLEMKDYNNCEQMVQIKQPQEVTKEEELKISQAYSTLITDTQKFRNKSDISMKNQNSKTEEQHLDSDEESGQLSRRNSQILLKLKREESVKRLISGWNKVTEHSDSKCVSCKQQELQTERNSNTQGNNSMAISNNDNLTSVLLNHNLKPNSEDKKYFTQKSSSKTTIKDKKTVTEELSLQSSKVDESLKISNSDIDKGKSEIIAIDVHKSNDFDATSNEERHSHGKLIGKATVIRRPSIAKLKALFEKSLNIEFDSSSNLAQPQRRHPLFRSHSHHLSREIRPQQERDTVLSMVTRKLLRSPLKEVQNDRQDDTKHLYNESKIATSPEIEYLTMLCAHNASLMHDNLTQDAGFNNATLVTENFCMQKQNVSNIPHRIVQIDSPEKHIKSNNAKETAPSYASIESEIKVKVLPVEDQHSFYETTKEKHPACRKKLPFLSDKSSSSIQSEQSKSKSSVFDDAPNPPDLPLKKKPPQPFGVLGQSGNSNLSDRKSNESIRETSAANVNDSIKHSLGKERRNELSVDNMGDYVVLRTKDPTIDVAFSHRRSQEEGIYGVIKQHQVDKESKSEEPVPQYAKPLSFPIARTSKSGCIPLSKVDDSQKNYIGEGMPTEITSLVPVQAQYVMIGKNKSTENYSEKYDKKNVLQFVEKRNDITNNKDDYKNKISVTNSSCITNTEASTTDIINAQYTNVNIMAKKNIAQIENILNQHPRGAILDLTSRKSYVLDDNHALGEKNLKSPVHSVLCVKNTSGESIPLDNSSKQKYHKIWLDQNNGYKTLHSPEAKNQNKTSFSNKPQMENEPQKIQEWDKQIYGVHDYRVNQDLNSSRNLLLHSPTPKSKRLHLARSSNKPKILPNSMYKECSSTDRKYVYEEISQCNNQITAEENKVQYKLISNTLQESQPKNNDNANNVASNVVSESPTKKQKNELKDSIYNKQYQIKDNKDYRINSNITNNLHSSFDENNSTCNNVQNQKLDSTNQVSSTSFSKSCHNLPPNISYSSPKHHSYESIYGHLEQFVKRKQQKLDPDYEYIYPSNMHSKPREKCQESVICNNKEETCVKTPISSPFHQNQNAKWTTVCENIPGSENWKLVKTPPSQVVDNIQNYAIGPPKPPRTFSQLFPGQNDGSFRLPLHTKQPLSPNGGGRLLVPVASPKSLNKLHCTQEQTTRSETRPSCYHSEAQNISAISNRSQTDLPSSPQFHQETGFYSPNSSSSPQISNQSHCPIYGVSPSSCQLQSVSSSNYPPTSSYHKVKDVPIYATVREHFPNQYSSPIEGQPQLLKSANTYENIYDAQRTYYGVNPACAGEEYVGRPSQQFSMHGLRHSQSDASVYVALRTMRPVNSDSSGVRPQPPPYNEAVKPRRVAEPSSVNRTMHENPYSTYSTEQRRSHDDMDLRTTTVSRLKQEAHARRSMVEWDLGMSVAPDSQDNSDMAQYSQVIKKPGIKKISVRDEKVQKEDSPPSVPQKTRGAYEMLEVNQSPETQEKANKYTNSHNTFSGTLSKAFGKLTLFTKFGSRNDQNTQQITGGVSNVKGDTQGKKTSDSTKAFSFPHRLPRKPRGSKHPPKQWTQV